MTTFAKVVKHSSFTAAADELGISRAMVSRHVTDLETHFGVRLLNRTTRSVTVTEAGKLYYEQCHRILLDIRAGEEAITAIHRGIEGRITILAPKWVGNFDLSEALTDFCKENPKISIQLTVGGISPKPHDFLERGFDVCIQNRTIRNSEIMVKKIGQIDYVLVASRDYIDARGEPKSVEDLLQHDCLTQPSNPQWHFRGVEGAGLKISSRFSSNSFLSLCTAAVGGLGIALLPRRVAAADMMSGALRQILPDLELESRPLYAVYAPGGAVPAKVRNLLEFLADWFRTRALSPDEPARLARIYGDARVHAKSANYAQGASPKSSRSG